MTQPTSEVRFGRLERRGLLMGLTGSQIVLVAVGLLFLVAAASAGGPAGVMLSAPMWACALAWALVPVGGRPLVELLPTGAAWAARRLTRTHARFTGPQSTPDVSSLVLPGVPGRVRIAGAGENMAFVRLGRRPDAPVVVIAEVRGSGFLLEDGPVQDRRVAAWGRLLGALGQLPDVAGIQVLHRSVPAPDASVRRWWQEQKDATAPWASLLAITQAQDGGRIQNLVAISVRPGRGDLLSVRETITEAVQAAELDLTSWLTPNQISAVIRVAYDPAAEQPTVGIRSCGPMGIAEGWSHLRTDSAFHATYWVSEWPRAASHPAFLRPLLLASDVRRTFTFHAQPVPPGKALREIRRARAEQLADAAMRARIGRVEEETHRAAAAELTRREEDLVAGHGDLRFVGLLAVSAATLDELASACAATEAAAAQAGCELRRLVGRQVQAYAAAALPFVRGLS